MALNEQVCNRRRVLALRLLIDRKHLSRKQRDRRLHRVVRGQRDGFVVGIARTFDQDDVGRERLERGAETARRAWPVMPNAENMHSHAWPRQDIAAVAVQILPAVTLFDHGFQVFHPDLAILHRVFDHRPHQPCRQIRAISARYTSSLE